MKKQQCEICGIELTETNRSKSYRNGSWYDEPVEDWEKLVEEGYAQKCEHKGIVYCCTKKGLQAIANATGLQIRYTIEVEPIKE